jgi:hypothetical protein
MQQLEENYFCFLKLLQLLFYMSMKVASYLPKVCIFTSSTNKMLKNARDTKLHKATGGIKKNAITLGFLAYNTLYYSNYGRLDAMQIQYVVIT